MVKLDLETLATTPDDPPAAGPDRALDRPLARKLCADVAEVSDAVVAVGEPLLADALTMP
jgi:hypothetical protein